MVMIMKLFWELGLLVLSIGSYVITGFYAPWLVWISLVPILYLTYHVSFRKMIIYSVIFGIVTPAWLFYWIAYYDFATYFACLALVASFYGLWPIISTILIKKIKHPLAIVVPPIIWSTLQFLYHFSIINSFWANVGIYAPMLAPLTWLIKGYGVAFLILLSNSLVLFYLIKKKKKYLFTWGILGIVVLSCFAFSNFAQPKGEALRIAIVQPNIEESFEWRGNHSDELISHYESQIRSITQKPSLIVLPEYAFATNIQNTAIESQLVALSKDMNATIVVGSIEWADEKNKTFFDVVYSYYPNASKASYHAIKPLPFDTLVKQGLALGFAKSSDKTIGLLACYEETQGELTRKLSENGASFFISLANNQRFGDSKGLELVSMHARLHSSENKRYLIRATNTGLTFVINPYGKKIAQLPPNQEGVLVADIFV